MPALLLDTNAILYLGNDIRIERTARSAFLRASRRHEVVVSPISAWEVGLLAQRSRFRFSPDPKTWFFDFVDREGVSVAPLLPEIMLDSWSLPGPFHADPADRLIVTTARHLGATVMTRDRRILDYAERGHVAAVAC
jgi:PIN domain nuclease of toxin-antitoxin system